MIPLALNALGSARRLPWQLYAALAVLALLWAHNHAVDGARAKGLREGAAATAALYVRAQAEADRLATVGVAATIINQQAIATEASHALAQTHTDIDARARAIGVRHDQAARRSPGGFDLPATGGAAPGACPAPAEDGLPWAIAFPAMTQAAKDLAQLNAILDYEAAQAALAERPSE